MRIKDISVENYRNLNSATITFDESCNFIVGENNLGKSNILNLLNIIFTRRGFVYDDFNDANLPITVNIRPCEVPGRLHKILPCPNSPKGRAMRRTMNRCCT